VVLAAGEAIKTLEQGVVSMLDALARWEGADGWSSTGTALERWLRVLAAAVKVG
jgi:hypothetical protein